MSTLEEKCTWEAGNSLKASGQTLSKTAGLPRLPCRGSVQSECILMKSQDSYVADLHELEDKVLGCWCKPGVCHGDVLIELTTPQPKVSGVGVGVGRIRSSDNGDLPKEMSKEHGS